MNVNWKAEIVAEGLEFPEGPVYVDEGLFYVTEIHGARVCRLRNGEIDARWPTGGGANGATRGSDGTLYVANNGGARVGAEGVEFSEDGVSGRIQRLSPEGALADLAVDLPEQGPHAPNDLCFGPDGLLYFTDPRWQDMGEQNPGWVHRTDLSGRVESLAPVARFPNGIAFGPDGRLYVAESSAKRMLVYDWSPQGVGDAAVFCELPKGFPDGFCFDADGHLIVCGSMQDTICIFDRDGALLDRFDTTEGTHPTNCCLGGGRLWVTYSGLGQLVCIDYPTPALPLFDERGHRS